MNWYGKSDIGKNRVDNQDCFAMRSIDDEHRLFLVCDGVGGAKGGAVASELISTIFADSTASQLVDRIREKGTSRISETGIREILLRALEAAKAVLCDRASSDSALEAMSTTLVALLTTKTHAYVLNIGDSRAYIHTSEGLARLTKDHSYVQGLVDNGILTSDEAGEHKYKNVITRSVGLSTDSTPDLFKVSTAGVSDCIFLLCSDGLTGMVPDGEIEKILSGSGSLRSKTEKLIRKANRAGGFDNITVVLAGLKN